MGKGGNWTKSPSDIRGLFQGSLKKSIVTSWVGMASLENWPCALLQACLGARRAGWPLLR
jgi:hypothetical protein